MARYNLKVSGTKGELTELVQDRRDLELYQLGMSQVWNWIVLKWGGWRRRSGSEYMGNSTRNNNASVFRKFIFSSNERILLEFSSDGFLRFWDAQTGSQIPNPTTPYEIASPYTTDLDLIQLRQENDVCWIVHPSHPVYELKRFATTTWTLTAAVFEDGPYFPLNDTANNLTVPSDPDTTPSQTFTFTNTDHINDGNGFSASTDIGRHFRFQITGFYYWCTISAVNSTTSIDVINITAVPSGAGTPGGTAGSTGTWQLGVMYTGNNPRAIEFYDSRLLLGGFTFNPRGVSASFVDVPLRSTPTDLDGTVNDNNGFYREIRGLADPILWMVEKGRVQLGTDSAIRTIGSKDPDAVMTARNFYQQQEENFGSSTVVPASVGASTLFAGEYGRSIHDLVLDGGTNRLQAPDISVLSAHLLAKGVTRFAWQQVPDRILWWINGDGELIGTTFDKNEEITGYHRHTIAGTNVTVEDVETIQGPDQTDVWLIVKRDINGSTVRYVERLQPLFDSKIHARNDAWLVDCGGKYTGVATNTVSGITHLANETVAIYADGSPVPEQTISAAGVLTLPNDREAETIIYGFNIPNLCETLPPPLETPQGSRMGLKTRVYSVVVSVLDSVGLRVGTRNDNLELVQFREAQDVMGGPLALITDRKEITVDDSWDDEGRIQWKVNEPLPSTVRGINAHIEVE